MVPTVWAEQPIILEILQKILFWSLVECVRGAGSGLVGRGGVFQPRDEHGEMSRAEMLSERTQGPRLLDCEFD